MSASDYTKIVPLPAAGDINSGYRAMQVSTLKSIFGDVFDDMPTDCGDPCDAVSKYIEEASVGPFNVTGNKFAILSLQAIFNEIKIANPDLYAILGTAGMLCWRCVRGAPGVPSNHACGLAIDMTIGGILTDQGAESCPQGLLTLYSHFHAHGWYWAAHYANDSPTDPMHMEIANETALAWLNEGRFNLLHSDEPGME